MSDLMTKLAKIADEADSRGDVETAEMIDSALQVLAAKLTTKQRKKAPAVFSPGKKVEPDKGRKTEEKHFPIPDKSHASNALARATQLKKKPKWYTGSLSSLKGAVRKKVHNKFPDMGNGNKKGAK